MEWKAVVQDFLRTWGYEITRYPIMDILHQYNVNVVLDVGANRGQYAAELRRLGYRRRIISFEPLSSAYEQLEQRAKDDPTWQTMPVALGSEAGRTILNIAGNSASSSFLEMLPDHYNVAPETIYTGEEEVEVQRLDALPGGMWTATDRLFLKIDTQGFEWEVLLGARGILSQVVAVQVELSLVPLYKGQPLIEDIVAQMRKWGYVPAWFLPGFKDPKTQRLLQVDGLFLRSENAL